MEIYLFRIRVYFCAPLSIVCIRLVRAYAQFDEAIV